jgi:hypothetical protein
MSSQSLRFCRRFQGWPPLGRLSTGDARGLALPMAIDTGALLALHAPPAFLPPTKSFHIETYGFDGLKGRK